MWRHEQKSACPVCQKYDMAGGRVFELHLAKDCPFAKPYAQWTPQEWRQVVQISPPSTAKDEAVAEFSRRMESDPDFARRIHEFAAQRPRRSTSARQAPPGAVRPQHPPPPRYPGGGGTLRGDSHSVTPTLEQQRRREKFFGPNPTGTSGSMLRGGAVARFRSCAGAECDLALPEGSSAWEAKHELARVIRTRGTRETVPPEAMRLRVANVVVPDDVNLHGFMRQARENVVEVELRLRGGGPQEGAAMEE